VQTYSASQISVPSDKLVALSAIAKAFEAVLKDEYVVGMWHRYLEEELIWSISPNGIRRASNPVDYRAPSWSWTAVDGMVQRSGYTGSFLMSKVEQLDIEHTTDKKNRPRSVQLIATAWCSHEDKFEPSWVSSLYQRELGVAYQWENCQGR
jgi:hypothetical protein